MTELAAGQNAARPRTAGFFPTKLRELLDASRSGNRWSVVERVGSMLAMRIEGIVLARGLGPAGFGAAQLLLYAASLAEIPLRTAPAAAVTYVKTRRQPSPRGLGLLAWQGCWLAGIAVAAVAVPAGIVRPSLLMIIAASMTADAYYTGELTGRLAWKPFAASRLIGWAARLSTLAAFLFWRRDLTVVAAACVAGNLVSTALAALGERALGSEAAEPPAAAKPVDWVSFSWGRVASAGALLALMRQSLYWVRLLSVSDAPAGQFAAALAVGRIVLYCWAFAGAWVLPDFVRSYREHDPAGWRSALIGALRFQAATSAATALLVAFFAGPILTLLLGAPYLPAAPAAALLAAGNALLSLHLLFSSSIWGQPWRVAALHAGAAALQGLLCWALFPSRGVFGAAAACTLSWGAAAAVSGFWAFAREPLVLEAAA